MPTINVNGCNFYYEQQGRGRDIIFIHGEIHGLQYFDPQLAEFSKDHRCFAYNRRGHAKTSWTEYGFSLVNQTRDLDQLITALDIRMPTIVAVAFGTVVAANYAINNPSKVRSLVLCAWSEMHDALQYFERWSGYNKISAEVLEQGGRDALVELLRKEGGKTLYKVIPVESPKREDVIQMFASHPVEEYRRGMLEFGLSVPNLVPEFRKLEIPVLGLCGAGDPYPDRPEVLAGMKNFKELPPIDGGGRFVHWERPQETNAAIRAFIDTLP